MGCWNGTCGISQLHINYGEDVLVVPIINQPPTDFCYPSSMWVPAPLSFWSKYNDYGAGEDSSGAGLPVLLEAIRGVLVEMEQGDNQYHDIPVTKAGFNEELFWEAIHEGRLSVQGRWSEEKRPVQMVMFKKSILDHLFANFKFQTYYEAPNGRFEDVFFTGNKILEHVPAFVDRLFVEYNKETEDGFRLNYFMGIEYLANKINEGIEASAPEYNFTALMVRRRASDDFSPIDNCFMEAFDKLANGNERNTAIELMTSHMMVCIIHSFMRITRHTWIPQTGVGGQHQEHSGYLALCDAITTVLAGERKLWEDEDE